MGGERRLDFPNCGTFQSLNSVFIKANTIGLATITQYTHVRNKSTNTQGSSPNVVYLNKLLLMGANSFL